MKPHFRKTGWFYLPASVLGWLITLVYLGVSLTTLVWIDTVYNSLFHSLVRFFPYFMGFTAIWYWISYNMSDR